MSSVTRVPETSSMAGDELTMEDARATLRHFGRRQLLWESFRRFRYGDGFSHSRALAFLVVLTTIPLSIAFVGLAAIIQQEELAQALQQVILSLTPGATGSESDDLIRETLEKALRRGSRGGVLALVLGLTLAVVAMTTAMGQVERGSNRIYGIQRDRPAARKYLRAFGLALLGGVPAAVGFVVLVAGGEAVRALSSIYAWSDRTTQLISWARWPFGVVLVLLTLTVVFRWAPRRRQPGYSWLFVGAGVALLLWLAFSGLLALYVANSGTFGQVYGPLTAVMALLVWAQLSSIALLLGMAFAAQLEAVRAGVRHGAGEDPEVPLATRRAGTSTAAPAIEQIVS
jgi:YihY family inner membrane protein